MLQTVGHTGSTSPAKVWHSEQEMVFQIGQEDGDTLFNLLKAALTGVPQGSEVLLVILEVHSHVRGICNGCARTLKSLITSQWVMEVAVVLILAGIDVRNMKAVLRTSADEYFSGGGASTGQQRAQQQPSSQIASYQHGSISNEHHQLPWDVGKTGSK